MLKTTYSCRVIFTLSLSLRLKKSLYYRISLDKIYSYNPLLVIAICRTPFQSKLKLFLASIFIDMGDNLSLMHQFSLDSGLTLGSIYRHIRKKNQLNDNTSNKQILRLDGNKETTHHTDYKIFT